MHLSPSAHAAVHPSTGYPTSAAVRAACAATAVRTELATFAAGRFWDVEHAFRQVPGVVDSAVGYTGGHTEAPTYRDVCTDGTGHAEAVRVVFDPARVSYEALLDVFFSLHDPTQRDRQGEDEGTQYRSAVFVHSAAQRAAAERRRRALEQSGRYVRPLATEVAEAAPFHPAEGEHQRYYAKNGLG